MRLLRCFATALVLTHVVACANGASPDDASRAGADTGAPTDDIGVTPPDPDAEGPAQDPDGAVAPADATVPPPPPRDAATPPPRDSGPMLPPDPHACSYLFTSSIMCPGFNCLECHTAGGRASRRVFTAAGTVYPGSTSAMGIGQAGARVTITDATGQTLNLTTNFVGNFYTTAPLTFPITATVTSGSTTQRMTTPAGSGGCGSCHGIPPSGGAPGRVAIGP